MEHKGTIRIETDRLVLKRHVLDDAEIMFKNWVTEKDVTKFLSWQPHKNVDETKQLLIDWIESYDKQDFYFWTIESSLNLWQISKLPGVNSASISFMAQKLTLDADEDKLDEILKQAEKIIKSIDEEATIEY